jgi:hypothetical protein
LVLLPKGAAQGRESSPQQHRNGGDSEQKCNGEEREDDEVQGRADGLETPRTHGWPDHEAECEGVGCEYQSADGKHRSAPREDQVVRHRGESEVQDPAQH